MMIRNEHELTTMPLNDTPFKLNVLFSLKRQILSQRFIMIACFLVSATVLTGILLIARITGANLRILTIDPADVELRPAYIGILSHFGVMLWSASAALCFFTASILKNTPQTESFRFLIATGVVCSVLLFDDALLLHDRVFPHAFGIPEKIVYLLYFAGLLLYLVRFISTFLVTDYLLLIIAASFLGISVLMDSIFPITSIETFIEDGMKFSGIVFWLAYVAHTTNTLALRHRNIIHGNGTAPRLEPEIHE